MKKKLTMREYLSAGAMQDRVLTVILVLIIAYGVVGVGYRIHAAIDCGNRGGKLIDTTCVSRDAILR